LCSHAPFSSSAAATIVVALFERAFSASSISSIMGGDNRANQKQH
jgi:hypothetical protein